MKFDRKNILSLLAQHQNNLDKKSINSIFSCIRLTSREGKLKIRSTDGEKILTHEINQQLPDFDIFLPGQSFYDLLRKSSAETFSIEELETSYKIDIGKGSFSFSKHAEANMPIWPIEEGEILKFDSKILSNAIKLVRWAASNDEIRPHLNGICFDFQKNSLNLCATDGLRLALYTIPCNLEVNGSWIMSKKSVNEMAKIMDEISGDLDLCFAKNCTMSAKTQLSLLQWKSLLVGGQFPQYSKIIPQSSAAKFSTDCNEFLNSIERMLVMANINQPVVTMNFSKENSSIFAENALSSGKDDLLGNYEGAEMKISFNGRLLSEVLNNFSGKKITIELNNPHAPVLIKSEELKNALFVIAPLKREY